MISKQDAEIIDGKNLTIIEKALTQSIAVAVEFLRYNNITNIERLTVSDIAELVLLKSRRAF